MIEVLLHELAYARSGDKGDVCNIGIMAKSPRIYARLLETVTVAVVREFFGDMVRGEVEVYPMPNIDSIQIVLRAGLGGGATTTLRYDQTGKSMGTALLRLPIEVDAALAEEARLRTREIEEGA
jgi:hypothetical protein